MKKLFILLTISLLIINAGCNKIPEQEETQNQNENTATDNDNKQETVKIYFVALEDAGKSGEKIGCDDSLIAVDTQIEASQRIEDKITKSLEKLFEVKEKQYGESGLYNALADATLKVENVGFANDQFVINLSGEYSFGGVCELPRFENQIKATIKQFSEAKEMKIFMNGKSFEEVFSLKGE